MIKTPQANRYHIGIFGKCNSGKSSLINAITGQSVAVVSEVPGTTTDIVHKSMEVSSIGPCLFIDTPGFNDDSTLGLQRLEQARKAVDKVDVAVMIYSDMDITEENRWVEMFKKRSIPVVTTVNYNEKKVSDLNSLIQQITRSTQLSPVVLNAKTANGVQHLIRMLAKENRKTGVEFTITGNLVQEGDTVLLVMPQDIQAPEGRLILPQSQTIRELLEKKCITVCCTPSLLDKTLKSLSISPKLVITDAQAFKYVDRQMPPESMLTSFSVLFAYYKGDIQRFIEGAKVIDKLTENSRILIAEVCTHTPLYEDIGRVKLPRMLRQKIGENLQIDTVSGIDFPADLTSYDLVIHCGACVFNRKQVMSRVNQAVEQNVPITNYGVAIAGLLGMLHRVVYPGK